MSEIYDAIGRGYASRRMPDPRIQQQIDDALGDAATVVNVGAGTGSYEPAGRRVVAAEPSRVMIDQRKGDAPVVRAYAEALPFADACFDAALACLTVHHWHDGPAGLREMRRVAGRQVVFAFDLSQNDALWLTRDYMPEARADERARVLPLEAMVDALGGDRVRVLPVPVPHDCRDGFLAAYWRRPHAYLDAEVHATISFFAQLGDEQVAPAVERLRHDLESGAWHERYGDLLDRETLDVGYRLLVAG